MEATSSQASGFKAQPLEHPFSTNSRFHSPSLPCPTPPYYLCTISATLVQVEETASVRTSDPSPLKKESKPLQVHLI